MKYKLIPLLLTSVFAGTLHAECILNTTTVARTVGQIDEVVDVRKSVSASVNGERKCFVSMRVRYKNEWHTVYSDYTGTAPNGDLCANAIEIGKRQFLMEREPRVLQNDQQMLCTDETPIVYRSTVTVGDKVKFSELRPHPVQKKPFMFKGTECWWFVEPSMRQNQLYQWQGVVCKTGHPSSDEWSVIDKF